MAWTEAPTIDAALMELTSDTADLTNAATLAYIRISSRVRRFGAVPYDFERLAKIARVGLQSFIQRVLPQIEHLLRIENGLLELVQHAELPVRAGQGELRLSVTGKPRLSPEERSLINRRNAWARHHPGERFPADLHANAAANLANSHEADAKLPANSTTGAENLPANLQVAGVPPPHSLSDPSLSGDSEEELREREARAREADANLAAKSDANSQGSQTDAKSPDLQDQVAAAGATEEERPLYHPLPDEWVPNEEARQEARSRSCDVNDVARKFRIWAHEEKKRAKDWDARFIKFLIDERAAPDRSQTSMPQVIRGGAGLKDVPSDVPASEGEVWRKHSAVYQAWNGSGRPGPSVPPWSEFKRVAHLRDEVLDGLERHQHWYDHGRTGDQPGPFWRALLSREAGRSAGYQAASA